MNGNILPSRGPHQRKKDAYGICHNIDAVLPLTAPSQGTGMGSFNHSTLFALFYLCGALLWESSAFTETKWKYLFNEL